ncbi:MAG: conjugal transfer protein TraX [Beijerinckiaceae bacterium]|nr:conjugal transfer protein TraX [Beijerinckiaceae bacterium]
MTTAEPRLPAPPVTTTDALKAFALLLILVDHIGHFLADDWPILRVIGRLGVPIFFFLIGFARTRDIPWRWLALGMLLTGVDYLWNGTLAATQLNILFNFALIRLALPYLERFLERHILPLMLVLLACVLVMPFINPWLEYGAEGWLFAVLGLMHRKAIADNSTLALRDLAGFVAFAVYAIVEQRDYKFSVPNTALLVLGLAGIAMLLRDFRREDSIFQPPSGLRRALRFCGQHSLEIYAAQIVLLAALGTLWSTHGDNTETGDADD